jgi:tetratricopeptide (TPR) repeat protein
MSRQAGAAVDAGRRSTEQGDFVQALEHYRTATRLAPHSAAAQLARGEAAEALGEFDEALSAFQAAARRAPSTMTWLRLGEMADRMGQVDVAIQSLEQAYGPWRQHASLGLKVGVMVLVTCVPSHWPDLSALWGVCLPMATRLGRSTFRSSNEVIPEYVFRILVEAGRREQAIAIARTRGWLREQGDYCQGHDLPVSAETAGLLAMMLEPDRADCLLPLGVRITDEGLARLGRLVLLDRAQRSRNSESRAQAEWVLRYRLPDHEVPKLAESLNVTGWRLQNRNSKSTAALAVFTRAIDADPAFSWPYHNIGRLYMSQDNDAQALTWLTKALQVNPNHLRAQFNLGAAAGRLGRYDEALAAYTRVLTMDPMDAEAHASIGWLHLKAGHRGEGLRELQIAVRLEPRLDDERRYLDEQFGRDARQGPTPFSAR